jgi:hypothetical protein
MTPSGMSALAGHDTRTVWLVASAFGALALGALLAIYRQARRRRELEEAEAVLADAELDG